MPRPNGPGTAAHVRQWAQTRFVAAVGDTGLLPRNIIVLYNRDHPDTPYTPATRETRKDQA